jgi:hypothetical protein
MFALLVGAAAGYVLGTKAGRQRYEQMSKTARAIAASPATRKAIDVGRLKQAEALAGTPKLEPVAQIDEETTIYAPRQRPGN